jgi:predicted nucleic acid-binding protein
MMTGMAERKITLNVPEELLEAAQRTSGQGVTDRQAGIAAGRRRRNIPPRRQIARVGEVLGQSREAPGGSLMLAADTSSMVAFLQDGEGADVDLIQAALDQQQLVLPPVVLTELLSEPALPPAVRSLLAALPQLDIEPGYWERAGLLRASILKQRRQARVADALIAQSCLDQSAPLVTRDKDFRHFAKAAGLSLL